MDVDTNLNSSDECSTSEKPPSMETSNEDKEEPSTSNKEAPKWTQQEQRLFHKFLISIAETKGFFN
jgi:hypothetical protein